MFDAFSIRSRQVVFLTRLKTGQRGADALDIGDLIAGIVVEDQNMIERFMGIGEGEMGRIVGLKPHPPFFSEEHASDLLTKLDGLLSHSTPIPNSTNLPITSDLGYVFASADQLRNELRHEQVEPLHLLAGALRQTRPEVDLLNKSGITAEGVLAKLRGEQ